MRKQRVYAMRNITATVVTTVFDVTQASVYSTACVVILKTAKVCMNAIYSILIITRPYLIPSTQIGIHTILLRW